jgi:hypothetical protein
MLSNIVLNGDGSRTNSSSKTELNDGKEQVDFKVFFVDNKERLTL